MKIIENYNLINNNSFGLDIKTSKFIEFDDDRNIIEYISNIDKFDTSNFLIIGSGSNILFTKDFEGSIIHPITDDINIVNKDDKNVYVEASAGLLWDNFVAWSLQNNFYGLENLSLIPGTVGASAVQNIGAYGTEAANCIYSVKYFNIQTKSIHTIYNKECNFEYRSSAFKTELANKVLILSVTFKLDISYNININYVDFNNFFSDIKIENIDANMVRNAVIAIRSAKLPDVKIMGNAGSFFKNPIVEHDILKSLLSEFPDIKYYKHHDSHDKYKLAAGWLIDKCGLKAYRYNAAAVHDKQALVIVNTGGATSNDIIKLAEHVQYEVYNKFKIKLEPEVIWV